MRLLLYEHLTAWAGIDPTLPASLAIEGWAMLSALCADARRLENIEVHTVAGLPQQFDPAIHRHHVDANKGWLTCFVDCLAEVDAALIIAPEFNAILETLTHAAEMANRLILGSSSAAIAWTADKWRCACRWRNHAVPTPETVRLSDLANTREIADVGFPLVLKPRDGAGSLATVLISQPNALDTIVTQVEKENPSDAWIAQRFVPGHAASVACIVGAKEIRALPAASQELSADGRFHYQGGQLPLAPALSQRAQSLARQAVSAIDGLRGYVGVDLVLGDADDGSGDRAIELNPRITTSYLGLRALCKENLLEVILSACAGNPIPDLTWHNDRIEYDAHGNVQIQ